MAQPRHEVRQVAEQTLHLQESPMTPTAARTTRPDQPAMARGLHQWDRLDRSPSSHCDLGGRLPVTRCRTSLESAPTEQER